MTSPHLPTNTPTTFDLTSVPNDLTSASDDLSMVKQFENINKPPINLTFVTNTTSSPPSPQSEVNTGHIEDDLTWAHLCCILMMISVVLLMMYIWCWVRSHVAEGSCRSEGVMWAAPGGWVRPLSYLEHFFSDPAAFNSYNTAQVLYLQSPRPLETQIVRRALTILAERVLVLQLGLVWRGWWPWFRRMKTVNVELKESNEEPLAVYQQQLNVGYQVEDGPLWRATLVHRPPVSPDNHEAVLVLTLHHVITDGTTNMIICRDFVTIINSLVTGEGGDTPVRGLVPPLSNTLTSSRDLLQVFPFILSMVLECVLSLLGKGKVSLLPKPPPGPRATETLVYSFTENLTTQLSKRCKEANVRIHSCLLAASALAFLRTARKNGQRVRSLPVTHESSVNLRRYYPTEHKEALGNVIFAVFLTHVIEEEQDFWNISRMIQKDLYEALNEKKTPLKYSRGAWMMSIIFPINKLLSWLGLRSLTYAHFTVTNMGDLDTLLPATYDGPVKVSGVVRRTAGELCGMCYCVTTQTLAGRLLFSLDGYSTKTTEEGFKDFYENIKEVLSNVATYGTPNSTSVKSHEVQVHTINEMSTHCI